MVGSIQGLAEWVNHPMDTGMPTAIAGQVRREKGELRINWRDGSRRR